MKKALLVSVLLHFLLVSLAVCFFEKSRPNSSVSVVTVSLASPGAKADPRQSGKLPGKTTLGDRGLNNSSVRRSFIPDGITDGSDEQWAYQPAPHRAGIEEVMEAGIPPGHQLSMEARRIQLYATVHRIRLQHRYFEDRIKVAIREFFETRADREAVKQYAGKTAMLHISYRDGQAEGYRIDDASDRRLGKYVQTLPLNAFVSPADFGLCYSVIKVIVTVHHTGGVTVIVEVPRKNDNCEKERVVI